MNSGNRISGLFLDVENGCSNIDDALLLIVSGVNRKYFSGFSSSSGYLVLLKGASYLILDARYYGAALNKVKGIEVVLSKDFNESLLNIINKHKIKKILVETKYITLDLYQKLEKVSLKAKGCLLLKENTLDLSIEKLRSIKTSDEIEKIERSQRITQKSFDNLINFIKPGVTELEIATEFEFFAKKLGASSIAFDVIVASGNNSSFPHSKVSNRKIEEKDIILLDLGVNFDGYMSDMSRTVFVGAPTEKQKEVYNLVLAAQNLAISKIKPGTKCAEVDKVARDFINKTNYSDCFLHATGHGAGLNIHEKPFIAKNSKDVFEPGMIVTVEPGIYIRDEFGVRIEDMVLITENGNINLTSTPKELVVL